MKFMLAKSRKLILFILWNEWPFFSGLRELCMIYIRALGVHSSLWVLQHKENQSSSRGDVIVSFPDTEQLLCLCQVHTWTNFRDKEPAVSSKPRSISTPINEGHLGTRWKLPWIIPWGVCDLLHHIFTQENHSINMTFIWFSSKAGSQLSFSGSTYQRSRTAPDPYNVCKGIKTPSMLEMERRAKAQAERAMKVSFWVS